MSIARKMSDEFSDDDDGFGDFLSEDEEECALQVQEMAALERKMKTAGIRDGIEFGKEDTLQQGFDQGFAVGAVSSYRFSVLRGALSAAKACGLLESLETEDQSACETSITNLKAQEVKCAFPASATATTTQLGSASVAEVAGVSGEEVISRAQSLLEKLQISLSPAELTPAASSTSV